MLIATITWGAMSQLALGIPDWVVMYTLAGLLVLVERFHILVSINDRISVESVYLVGFSLVYPSNIIVWAGLLYAVVSSIQYRSKWYIQLFNGVNLTLSALFATKVFHPGAQYSLMSINQCVLGLAAFAVTFLLANFAMTSSYITLTYGVGAIQIVRGLIRLQFWVVMGITVLIGVLLSIVLAQAGLSGAVLFTFLILLVSYSYRDYFRMATHFKELSIKDELTGLFNHRYIQSKIDDLIATKQDFAVMMLDVDHFKRYNEVWGHVRGDEALKSIADVLRANRLPDEEVARYSGEEFLVVLPGYDLAQANLKAELLRRAIEDTNFPGAERLPGKKLTVSIGVAQYPMQADTKSELLMKVDDALYKGKFTGRNKVSLYTSVLDDMQRELTMDDANQEIVKTIKVFLAILNSKDRYTYAHTERDVIYAMALAKRIGLPESSIRYLRFGAFLHDIGKVEVPTEVLTKRGPLTREEWQIMKSHVELGENIARPIPSLAPCLPIIRHHHERFDGTGYPDGLKGEEIPIEARILTIADSFDAMTTSRPYQRKRTMEEAFAELRSCAGRQFDPDLVEPFIEVVRETGLLSADEGEENPA